MPVGDKRAKWSLLSMAHATMHEGGEWSGLVVVDTDGDVVWHVDLALGHGFVSWDRLTGAAAGADTWAVLRLHDSNGDMCNDMSGGGGGANCSSLLTLDASGAVRTRHTQSCEGSVLHYNSLHHECLHVGGTKVNVVRSFRDRELRGRT
jgi:hypothetical protein